MSELAAQPALPQVGRPLSLIPVGLKEAVSKLVTSISPQNRSATILILCSWIDILYLSDTLKQGWLTRLHLGSG
jgi:hypothetical protein